MIYIIIVLIVLLIASLYGNYNLTKKIEHREDSIGELEIFVKEFSDNLSLIDKQLTEIDTRGTFEADDEVGYTFKSIKLITEKLQTFNINYAQKKEE